MKNLLFAVLILFAAVLRAEMASQSSIESSIYDEDADEDDSEDEGARLGPGGWLDLRPGWTPSRNAMHWENEAAVELRWAENRSVGYTQEFVTRTESPSQFQLENGYLWSEFTDLIQMAPELTLTYQPRLYFPTSSTATESEMVFAVRQDFRFHWRLSHEITVALWEIPIIGSYKVDGFETEEELVANPTFENRIEFGPHFTLLNGRLKCKVPLIWQAIRARDFDSEAANNASWTHLLWLNPEALVRIVGETYLGLAYYSDSFLSDELSNVNIGQGLRRGVAQVVLQQNL